jgi:hypothetical protein
LISQKIKPTGNNLLTPEASQPLNNLNSIAQSALAIQYPKTDDQKEKKRRKRPKQVLSSANGDNQEISSRTGNSRYHQGNPDDATEKSVDYLTNQRLKRAEQEGLLPKRVTEA